jgi:FKBP-type peptidyl-prolyl cis-trans isomerase FkpA
VSFQRSYGTYGRRLAASIVLVAAAVFASACGDADSASPDNPFPSVPASETYAAALGVNIAAMTKVNDNLYYQNVVVGAGTEATTGRILRVTYSGYLTNGTKFDSNVGGTTLAFRIGDHEVIPGWEIGLAGMRVGGKRKLVIGSTLAYGSQGRGTIPGNATLVFDVELVSVS